MCPSYRPKRRRWIEHSHACKTTDPLQPVHQQAIRPVITMGSSGGCRASSAEEEVEEDDESKDEY